MIPLEQRTEKFLIPSKKDLLETNFSGFLMRTKLFSRKIIGTRPHLNVPTKERCWLWCIHMSFCKALIVVERQPFRLYSQRRASSWNSERFIKSCVSFARWKRFTQSFPVDGRLPASFWQQRIPQKNRLDKEVGNAGLAYRQPPKVATVCFMQYMTSYFASKEYLRLPQKYALTEWIISEVTSNSRRNSSQWIYYGTLICEEWLWKLNGVSGLLYGASSTCSKSRWQ